MGVPSTKAYRCLMKDKGANTEVIVGEGHCATTGEDKFRVAGRNNIAIKQTTIGLIRIDVCITIGEVLIDHITIIVSGNSDRGIVSTTGYEWIGVQLVA